MSQVNQTSSQNGEGATLLLAVGGLAFVCWLWFHKVVWLSCTLLYWLWTMVDFQRVHPYVATKINMLAITGNEAVNVGLHEWLDVMNATSGILLIFLLPILVCGLIGVKNHPSLPFRTKRIVNIHTLPRIMSRFAPTIIPVLAESKSPDLFMNDISPEHRWAERPEDFAERHALVEARTLDRSKSRTVFLTQLGSELSTPDKLRDYEKALFAIFGLQVFMGDRKATKKLPEDLNRSCIAKGKAKKRAGGKLYWPDFSLAEKPFQKVWASKEMRTLLGTHRYVRTALTGLLGRDIRLPPSQYLWLKGIDRTLWYALHGADSPSVFIEGAGVVAQARFEVMVKQEQLDLQINYVDTAIDGLQRELEGLGVVHPLRETKVMAKQKEPDWKPTTLTGTAFSEAYDEFTEPAPPAAETTPGHAEDYDQLAYPDWPEASLPSDAPPFDPEFSTFDFSSSTSQPRASTPAGPADDDDFATF